MSETASNNSDSGGLYAKRVKIYARSVTGLFNNWRWGMVFLTQIIFYGLCWLPWNGRQAVLFHLVERKFYLFGLVLWPQDVIYLAILLVISAYGLFLVTAIAGRLFCGYACPQTVYTEIFMWIERITEGDRSARMKLDKQDWNGQKIGKKAAKFLLWGITGLWTGITLVCYFSPASEVMEGLANWTLGPWETFWIFFYGGFTILMAGFMREQVCKYMCPYARFQSVMFDADTLVITYDPERGEPRGARKKGAENKNLGDCVDCGICVQVCPTGIDIRNGLQYECIGCAACIDGCDQVMEKLGQPKGLIRYSTENAMAQHLNKHDIMKHVMRPRIMLYTAILFLICLATAWSISHRIPLKADVIRDRASLAREADDGRIENAYTLRIMNTDERDHVFTLGVEGVDSISLEGAKQVTIPGATTQAVQINVRIDPEAGQKGANTIFFDITAQDDAAIRVREKASFMRP